MSHELQDITTHNLSQPAPATTRYPTGGYFLSFLWRWTFDSMASASRGAKRQRPIFVFDSLGHFFWNEKHLLSGWQSTARCFKESCYNLLSLNWKNIVGLVQLVSFCHSDSHVIGSKSHPRKELSNGIGFEAFCYGFPSNPWSCLNILNNLVGNVGLSKFWSLEQSNPTSRSDGENVPRMAPWEENVHHRCSES